MRDFAVVVFLLAQERQEAVLERRGAAVQDDLRIDEGSRRDDEAIGLEVTEPGLVVAEGAFVGVGHY